MGELKKGKQLLVILYSNLASILL